MEGNAKRWFRPPWLLLATGLACLSITAGYTPNDDPYWIAWRNLWRAGLILSGLGIAWLTARWLVFRGR